MENQRQMSMRDYARVVFRHKMVLITSILTTMATVIIGLMLKTPVYEARVKMLVSAAKQVEAPYYRELAMSQNIGIIASQAEVVNSDPVLERAVRAMGLYELPLDYENRFCTPLKSLLVKLRAKSLGAQIERMPPEQQTAYRYRLALEHLRDSLVVEPIRDTNLFFIKARDFSPYGSAVIANIVSRSYTIFDLEQQLAELRLKYGDKHLSVTQFKDTIEKMEKSLDGKPLPNIEAIGPASVKIIEQAQIPLKPAGVSRPLTLALAFFMSVFLGIMLVFVFEYLDHTVKSPDDIEHMLGIAFLGSVICKAKPKDYKNLAEQVYLLMKNKGLHTLALTSAGKGEKITALSHGLGKCLASAMGHRVLVIDTIPEEHPGKKKNKTPDGPGLFEVLEGKAELAETVKEAASKFFLLPVGTAEQNPNTLLESPKMAEILKLARSRYELVLVNTDTLSASKVILKLSCIAEAVAIIISEGRVRHQVLKRVLDELQKRHANILGAILNNRTHPIPKFIYERM